MEFELKEIIKAGGPIFIFLVIISIYSVSIIIEKYVEFKKIIFKNSQIITKIMSNIKNGKVNEIVKYAYTQKGSIYEIITSLVNHPGNIKEKREYITSIIEYQTTNLSKKLNALATIGSTAPYIGLFGTVIGVIRAFKDMAQFQSAGPQVIAHGISEALINTAMGLFVAIPAVIAYNYFVSRINRYNQELNYFLEQIIDKYYRNENT
ncbi:MAG: MotA/TolQ/ExbB proton channel family protein [Elusimicrobiales bacterium]|nr:MotA/TolQ/ExbB proton channel family protein [Elusimicrobiales bacterium]